MKDEIKEILDKLDKIKTFGYNPDIINSFCYRDLITLLDYITNLQEENKDYKSRIEKSSNLIRFIAFNSERPLSIIELNKVYNILQGVGKDE